MKRLTTPLLALAIFLLNLWLCGPFFMPGELPFRGSIELGYVGMARFVSEHPNPWGWNPLPYCGLPTQFMYVPAVPYITAAFIRLLPHLSPDMIYRTIVGLMTCLGPVTLFLFALCFTGSRRWAFGIAVAYSLFSASYALFPAVEKDRGLVQLPWRVQVLAKYGEGPHNSGLTLLPLALLALWKAGTGRTYARILAAALLLAAIPLTNWVAAMGLAISSLLLLVAAWGDDKFRTWRALAAAALAWLLACFWLTPSFIRTIAFNWPTDSFGYQLHNSQMWLLAGVGAGVLLIRVVFRFLRGSFYFCFVTLGAFAFGWIATAFYLYGVDTIPESRRYAIEFELFLALAVAEGLRLAMRSSNSTTRLCAIGTGFVIFLVGAPQLWAYASQGWSRWRPSPVENTLEYRLADWIAQHRPQGRVFASGGLRFRLNSWFDIPQVGGGFETGLQNRVPVDMAWRIRTGTEDPVPELKALDAQYVVVHGPKSREYYRDFLHPERLAALPVVYRTEDDTIYALPAGPNPMQVRWLDAATLTVEGPVLPGQPISIKVNADPGWQATQNGRPVPLTKDDLGFIVLHPAPSPQAHLELHYQGTAEQRIMAAISVLAWLAALCLVAPLRQTLIRPGRKTAPPSRPAAPPESPSSAPRSPA